MPEALQTSVFNKILAVSAGSLLVFVTISVIYLSIVEWRDRRRRKSISKKKS